LFEELKENVELSRKKIRKCMVMTGKETDKISWNSIWNELQKTDWHASTELTQRLKVWYLLRETFSTPNSSEPKKNVDKDCGDKQENRDLSHTLPAFMIESLVQPGDCWDEDAATNIILNKPSIDQQGPELGGWQQQDAIQDLSILQDSGVDSTNEYLTKGQSKDLMYSSFPVPHQPERISGYMNPQPNPLDSLNYQAQYSLSQRQSKQRHDIQQKQRSVKKEHRYSPADFLREEKKRPEHKPNRKSRYSADFFSVDSPPFIPRAHKMVTQRNWQFEAEAKGFNRQSNYRVKPGVPRRSKSNHFHLRPLRGENTNAEKVPWRPPPQDCLRRMPMEKSYVKPGRSMRSSPQKYNLRRLDMENPKSEKPAFTPRNESKTNAPKRWRYRLRAALQKQKKQHYNAQRETSGRAKGPIFPPRHYRRVKGDWVVHAIVSLSVQPNDLRLALEKRGYELKYITKRKCKLKDKWFCSLIANADRTHVLTSENIWVNSWEVVFVCNKEEIARFLLN